MREFVSSAWGLQEYAYTILPGIWAYLTDWARKHGGALLEGDPPSTEYELHRYSAKTRRSDGQKKRLVTRWNDDPQARLRAEPASPTWRCSRRCWRRPRERGVRVVLLELPLNEEIVGDSFAASQRRYREPVAALARDYDAAYIDLNQTVDIPSRDFQDLSHLLAPGRAVWQHALAKELTRLISTEDSGGSSG